MPKEVFDKKLYKDIRKRISGILMLNLDTDREYNVKELVGATFIIASKGISLELQKFINDNNISFEQRKDILNRFEFRRQFWSDFELMFYFSVDFALSLIIYGKYLSDWDKFKKEHYIF